MGFQRTEMLSVSHYILFITVNKSIINSTSKRVYFHYKNRRICKILKWMGQHNHTHWIFASGGHALGHVKWFNLSDASILHCSGLWTWHRPHIFPRPPSTHSAGHMIKRRKMGRGKVMTLNTNHLFTKLKWKRKYVVTCKADFFVAALKCINAYNSK